MNRRDCLVGLGTVGALALQSGPRGRRRRDGDEGPGDPRARSRHAQRPIFRPPPHVIATPNTHIFGPDANLPFFRPTARTRPPDAPLAMFKTLHDKIGFERAVVVNATLHGFDNRVGDGRDRAKRRPLSRRRQRQRLDERKGPSGARRGRHSRLPLHLPQALRRGSPIRTPSNESSAGAAALRWHVRDLPRHRGGSRFRAAAARASDALSHRSHGARSAPRTALQGANFRALLDLQRSDEKCWVKISGPERASSTGAPFHDAVPFAKAPDRRRARSRSSGAPTGRTQTLKVMPNDGDLVDLIPLYAPDPAVRQKLLVDNPARLYRF